MSDKTEAKLLHECITFIRHLIQIATENHKTGKNSREAVECLHQALSSLCRCQDYFGGEVTGS